MATNELFDTGIKVTGSFSAAGAFPVDGKYVVNTIAERDDHVTQNRAYDGMEVYVKENKTKYRYQINDSTNTGEWIDTSDVGVDEAAVRTIVTSVVNDKFREINQEDYNNLTEEEKNNGTIYFITDGETGDNVVDIISGNGIFIATADTTTYNEIKTAFDEGKHIFCKEEVDTDSYIIYSLVDFNYDKFIFSATTSERIQFFTVNSSGWTSSYKDIDSSSAPFIATYGETPFGDIYNAYTSGRVVFVEFLEGIEIIRACLNKDVSSVELCFSATTSDGIYLFKVTETDEWSYELESFEALSNLLASI